MKKALSLAVLFAGISLATFAQEQNETRRSPKKERKPRMEKKMENHTPEQIAEAKTERLDKKLDFTEAQRAEVYAVQLEQAQRTVTQRKEMKKLHGDVREEMKGSHEKMEKILTPEQKEKLKETYAQNRKGKFKGSKEGSKRRGSFERKGAVKDKTES